MNATLAIKLVDLGLAVAAGVPAALEAHARIKAMVAEGRDPTEAEIAEMAAVTDDLHARIQASRG